MRAPRSCASPIRLEQDLGGRLRVGQRAVARTRARAEELRERREPEARARGRPAGAARARPCRRRARRAAGRRGAALRRRGTTCRSARCARRARRRRRTRGSASVAAPTCGARPQLALVDSRQRRDLQREPLARIHERLHRRRELERLDAHRADLADLRAARREPGRLEVDDAVRSLLEQPRSAVPPASATQPPRHASRASATTTSSSSDRAMPSGRCCEREERARRVLDGNCAAPFLDELDEPVRRIEPKLHAVDGRRTYVRVQARKGRPLLGRPPFDVLSSACRR